MKDVFLLACKPYDFEGYKGFTLTILAGGVTFKIGSKEDYRPLLEKSKQEPIKGELSYVMAVKGGYLKASEAAFKAY